MLIAIQLKKQSVMKVGFIGAGAVTRIFGRHLIIAGHTIVSETGIASLDQRAAR
jgi:hypothetical protein